ncbi:MAG: FAD/NAD(P)-binding protein [Nitrospirota bacterium]
MKIKDIYLPLDAEIVEVTDMTPDIKLFKVKPERQFQYKPGQFIMASLWGKGEVPISITSTYGIHEYIELCIRRTGYVTSALHLLKPSIKIGIRGPFGNIFPITNARGKDILFVAGGLGLAPLRPLITQVMNEKKTFKRIALICGSRDPREILFKDDIDSWQKKGLQLILGVRKGLQLLLTIGKKDKSLQGKVSLDKEYLNKPKISFTNAYAFVCGPPIMINPTMNTLSTMGMDANNIFTSLEAHMKCGVGKCGHCYIDGKYVCTDGPVFSFAEIKKYGFY